MAGTASTQKGWGLTLNPKEWGPIGWSILILAIAAIGLVLLLIANEVWYQADESNTLIDPDGKVVLQQQAPNENEQSQALSEAEQAVKLNSAKEVHYEIFGDTWTSDGHHNRVQWVEKSLASVADCRASYDRAVERGADWGTFEEMCDTRLESLAWKQALLAEDVAKYNNLATPLDPDVLVTKGLPVPPIVLDNTTGLPVP